MDAVTRAIQRGEGQEMGRLIDADRLKERWTIASPEPYNTDAAEVLASIEEAPTVDAVEVVRCKDCKYYRESEHPERSGIKFCFRLMHPAEDRRIGYNFSGDDFCSCGEKRK